ncbi:MAG: DegT/DnrJ/EryC1/StrS family aminotransferase [Dehalococcoidales bacterium]
MKQNIIPWGKPCFGGKERDYVLRALDSTWISGGEFVDKLEADFARIIGRRFSVSTSNGTTALHLALLAADLGPGDEVIVPGFTFVAPANMVLQTGAKPVFADIDKDTWCIDGRSIEKCLTKKSRAIIAVHIYGNICDMNKIMEIARDRKLIVIEDVAEAAFSKYKGQYAGDIGDIGCFSFQATKTMTTGEGGIVLTDNPEFIKEMRVLRDHGMRQKKRYWHDRVGFNYRLTNLQAALGCAQLEMLDNIIKQKARIYREYKTRLSAVPGIKLQYVPADVSPVMWTVALQIDPAYFSGDRDFVMQKMLAAGIETRPGFYPFSVMPIYDCPKLPVAEEVSRNIISLPSFTSIKNSEIEYICHKLLDLMG